MSAAHSAARGAARLALGRREPTLAPLTRSVTGVMGDVYAELGSKERTSSASRVRGRGSRDDRGGTVGMEELRHQPVISGEDAFKLTTPMASRSISRR